MFCQIAGNTERPCKSLNWSSGHYQDDEAAQLPTNLRILRAAQTNIT